jgi:hypothetical protein
MAQQAQQDSHAQRRYMEVTRFLDRLDFLLGLGVDVAVANNQWFEFSPIQYSILYGLKAHARVVGAGTLTLRLRINGVTYDTISLTNAGAGAVVEVDPANQLQLDPKVDKLGVDCTVAGAGWQYVTFTVILEPRLIDVV